MTNLYRDTRGAVQHPLTFSEAIVEGLAPGGGLYVPEHIPGLTLQDLNAFATVPYAQQAAKVYEAFDIDLPSSTITKLMASAYGNNFDNELICPVTSLNENTHVLELWHGPTSAFKDMALQCLPLFFGAAADKLRAEGKLQHDFLILVATSGDTGKAALEGFRDKTGIRVEVIYPHGGVSDIQLKQMLTQQGHNVQVWGVEGNFDDCQNAVKAVFKDKAFAQVLLQTYGVALTSANSINWGRLMPQIVYYASAYAQLVSRGALELGQRLDVCVPTGNFGNILAAYYAKRMGVPLGMLFCASNENHVLTDFINTGSYSIAERPFVLTPSPSMDILVSSNLERQLFELTGRNGTAIQQWMTSLNETGSFRVDANTFAKVRAIFAADWVDNATCLSTIKKVLQRHDYLIDPHTAVALHTAENLRGEDPVLVVSTAHWAKFGENVYRGLHSIEYGAPLPPKVAKLSGCKLNELIAQETGKHNIPAGLAQLDQMPTRFGEVIESTAYSLEQATQSFIDRSIQRVSC